MKTPKNVKINGVSQINAQKTNTESGFSLETDLHFLSDKVMKNGTSSESYPDFDDEPQAGKMPEPKKEEKKGFSWGKLARNVLAGLAVAAVVTLAVAAVAVTAGFAAPVIGGILMGGAIGGVAAVGSMAASDIKRGEVSDITDYMGAGARESFIGALSGAIFGPFEAAGLGGKMLLGGVTNAFESVVRQELNGEDVNWWTVAQDASIGAATGGLFHFGGKAIKGASPYVKKATNKISSALSENAKFAKMAFKNMQNGPKSVVLGSNLGNVSKKIGDFADEFKKVKNSNNNLGRLDYLRKKYGKLTSEELNKFINLKQEVKNYVENHIDELNKKKVSMVSMVWDSSKQKVSDAYLGLSGKKQLNSFLNDLQSSKSSVYVHKDIIDGIKEIAKKEGVKINEEVLMHANKGCLEDEERKYLKAILKDISQTSWNVLNCGDIRAVNEALINGSSKSNLIGVSYNVGKQMFEGRCINCQITTKGVTWYIE